MTAQHPDRPLWPSIAEHLALLVRSTPPFTPADVERAYAFLFLPFLEYETPTSRATVFRMGLEMAIEEQPDDEQRALAKNLLLHDGPASAAMRRELAVTELSRPPSNRRADATSLARIETRTLENLARVLVSDEFAERFRARFVDTVNAQPLAPPPRRSMTWLSYALIATLKDAPDPFLRKLTAVRARSDVDGLRVVALPFFWIRPEPPDPALFPRIDVLSKVEKHSFVGFRPDPRPTSDDWFVAIFHLGAKRPVGNEFKLVYRETWADFAPNAEENNLAFSVHGQAFRHIHLSARLPPEIKPRRFRGMRFDTASTRKPEQLPISTYRSSATLHIPHPSPHGRYLLDWIDDLARPQLT
jgi:hypothetical protein